MKILYLGWGSHIHLARWAEHFAVAGEDVSVLSVSDKHDYKVPVRQFIHHFGDRRIGTQHLWVRSILAWVRPDIVHVHWLNFVTLIPPSWKGKIVVTGWGSDLYREHVFEPEIQRVFEANLSRVDWFTVDSADQRDVLVEKFGIPAEKIDVVQWGVDRSMFTMGPGFQEREPVIYSCRNITPIYNQEAIVRAFAGVREQIPEAKLILKAFSAQDPPYSQVMDLVQELGLSSHVEMLPVLPYHELPKVYQRARVSVSIPDYDGTPMSVLEAMACGSIPVVSDSPSLREWIDHERNGFTATAQNDSHLVQQLVKALTLDSVSAGEITRANADLVAQRADHKAHMDDVHAKYRSLIEHQ